MMTDKYCPRGEIKKLEVKMWNLKVKGTDVVGYNECFQELALMCVRMFPEESDKIKKYVGGFPDMIQESVLAYKPKIMQHAIEFATELMDKKISTFAERQAKKRGNLITTTKLNNNLPNSKCTIKCANYKRVGHLTRDCRSPATTNNQRNLTFYECGNQGHYKSDCPELKNQNHGNQARGVVCFGKRGKLNPRYVGPFKVMEKVGSVAYKIEFSQELSRVHHTFHVSNLKKCYADGPLAVLLDGLHIDDNLYFVEELVEIIDREVKRLNQSRIPIVKVQWDSRRGPEFT
ncbi:putative reverse transcriptase domain-containing protein [Tanacetum coccineum]